MSTNQRVVSTPNEMQLTESEIEVLSQHFSAALANVVSAKIEAESIVTETNIQPVIANRPRKKGNKGGKKGPAKKGGKKRPAKKGTKKGSAKKGTKKSAAKKGTKKGAPKTSKKK
jgi:hypothetical protein